ncbi:tape measure protein [Gordonia sp. JH63]|uniref:tape measure protein n=1 Tax=Gordonia sp. JH63 TaxID=2698900 RepID=UPI00131F524F|nr:tape measure protein [Gordonia sp. JH63]QHD84416.1 tape measure protein [Gordonia sp. JH63]
MGTALTKGFTRLDAIDQAQSKLRGLGHDARAVSTIMESANRAVKGTAFGLGDAATIAASAVAAGIKPGQELTKYLTMTADAAAIAGTDLADMGSILNQVATGGAAMTDDLNQFADRGIPVYQWLGKEMGVAAGEVKNLASDGKVSSEILFRAIKKNIGGAAQETGKTFRGSLNNMVAALGRFGAKLLDPIFSRAPAVFGFFTNGIDTVTKKVGPFVSNIGSQLGGLFKGIDLGSIKDVFANAFSGIDLGGVKGAFSGLFDSFGNLGAQLSEFAREAAPVVVGIFEKMAPIVGNVARVVGSILAGAFKALVGVISTVVNVVAGAVRIFNDHRGVILAVAGVIASLFLPALITMGATMLANVGAMAAMGAGMLAYNAAMRVVAIATRAWAAVQWVLNAALSANPIGIVIAAIVALVAGVVLAYKKSETFRNIVTAAWNGIKTAIGAVWGWLSTTVWPGMQAAFRVIGQVAMWLWQSVILPAWNGIKTAIGVAWTIIKGYFTAYMTVVKFLAGVVLWLWNNVIVPAFNGIKAAIGFAWTLIQPIFQAFMSVLRVVGTVATWLWKSVIVPVFNGIKAASQFMWTGVSVIFGWFKAAWGILGSHLRAVADNVIAPVWNAVKAGANFLWTGVKTIFDWIKGGWDLMASAIRTVWENVIRPAFDAVKSAVGKVGDMFSAVGEGIRSTWDKIKEYAAAPIRFVVNTVWNNGLLPVWRNLKKFLPIPDAPSPTPVAFAEGGPVPMGKGAKRGKDSVSALLMPDEHVWDVADVKRAGGHGAMYRMRNMVESGKPFTWTPGGIGGASEGGPLHRFAKGGAVTPGARLAPAPGEGGLRPIGQLMKRLIHALWPSIKTIGGYRQDAYPEHPSGRALDVMVGSDKKTGDQVNAWAHANHPKFPLTHSIWQQSMWYPPKMRREGMPDRGSPTQNHMDHPHVWWEEQAVNPNVVPEGLVGFDGMTPEDKKSWLQNKAKEIIDGMFGGLRDAVAALFPGGESVIQNIPKEFTNGMFAKMLEQTRSIISKIANPGFWYDKGKGLLGSVTKSIWGGVKSVGGLLRDTGGFVPTGQSVVTNETGKPEAVLNWQQLQDVIKQMETGATLAEAVAKVGAQKTDTAPEGAVVLKHNASLEDVKTVAAQIEAKERTNSQQNQQNPTGDTETRVLADSISESLGNATMSAVGDSIRAALGQKNKTGQGGDPTQADVIAERFSSAAKTAVSEQAQDAMGLFSIPDSPSLLNAFNQFMEAKKKHDTAKAGGDTTTDPSTTDPTTTPGTDNYTQTDPSGQLQYKEEKSKIQDVAEGPGGMPNIQYNPGGGAEQWRPLAQWAIDYVNRTMKGPAQTQAMVEQIDDESGGNPRAVNNWDINAQNGVPSGGLLQVIEPTFQANRDPALPNDKFNPGANLVAALRYYVGRYGTNLTTRWGSGKGGYKKGGYTGNISPNKAAGIVHGQEFVMPKGPTARNGAMLEAMRSGVDFTPVSAVGGGADNSTHFHNPVFRDEREFYERQSRMQRARQRAMSGGRG